MLSLSTKSTPLPSLASFLPEGYLSLVEDWLIAPPPQTLLNLLGLDPL